MFVIDDPAWRELQAALSSPVSVPLPMLKLLSKCERARELRVAYVGPQLLAAVHLVPDFACEQDALDDLLKHRALAKHQTGTTRTWVVTESSPREVVAFYASCTGCVLRSATPKKIGKG